MDQYKIPAISRRVFWCWDSFIKANPLAYIDHMAQWQISHLIIWNESFLLQNPQVIDYAHERNIRIIPGIGLYSYRTVEKAPVSLKRAVDAEGRIILDERGSPARLCPSNRKNQEWMKEYVLKVISKLDIDGVHFETGSVDFGKCICKRCREISEGEGAVQQVNPIVDSILRVNPSLWVSCEFKNKPKYYPFFSNIDHRCTLIWWGWEFPGSIEEGKAALSVRENAGFGFQVYKGGVFKIDRKNAGLMKKWREEFEMSLRCLWEWINMCREFNVTTLVFLIETPLYTKYSLFLPATLGEIARDPGQSWKEFKNRLGYIREKTIVDPALSRYFE